MERMSENNNVDLLRTEALRVLTAGGFFSNECDEAHKLDLMHTIFGKKTSVEENSCKEPSVAESFDANSECAFVKLFDSDVRYIFDRQS